MSNWKTLLILSASVTAFAVLVGLGVTHSTYTIPSASMAPNVSPGDWVLARGSKFTCGRVEPKIGDIAVHRFHGTMYIRRIVAGPGTTVQLRNGVLMLDGQPVRTERLNEAAPDQPQEIRETLPNGGSYIVQDLEPDSAGDNTEVLTTPAGHWFGLGDNRDNVQDSRFTGPVPASDICAILIRRLSSSVPGRKAGPL